ncbi:glycosyltransferase family 9 protein [Synechococcus sp. BS56D]|uniref:glycosyltransferase family 9 protein n=1 Tax=Synechococcus sp. BS56D TaxID=2055944 RepID=UPI003514114C
MSFKSCVLALSHLKSRGIQPVICGSGTKLEVDYNKRLALLTNTLNLTGNITLGQLVVFLKNARCVVANDSGASNLAQLLGIPALIFFGTTTPYSRIFGNKVESITNGENCEYYPCINNHGNTRCLNHVLPFVCHSLGDNQVTSKIDLLLES